MIRLFCLLALLPFIANAFDTPAKQAYLYDATTGTTLFSKNSDKRMTPSSMTKLMTIYILFEKLQSGELKLDDKFYVSEKAWKKGGSKMFVKAGDKISVEDLIRGIVVQSGNDACIVVAEGIAGTEEAFAEIMNVKAHLLDMKSSNFRNSTGWPDPDHYMTAHDISRLSEALIRDFPKYYHYLAETTFTYANITQHNRNSLIGELGIDGLKTGHTDAGGYGIAVSGEQKGRRLISVVNGLDSKKGRIVSSRQLLTYGFKQFEAGQLFANEKPLDEVALWYGAQDTVPVRAEKPLLITLPKYDKSKIKFTAKFVEPVIAPVQKGQQLGVLTAEIPNMEAIVIPLIATKSVAKRGALGRILPTLQHRFFGEK